MDDLPTTDPELLDVLATLRAREPLFHRAELGTSAPDLERQTAADFWEVGAGHPPYPTVDDLDGFGHVLAGGAPPGHGHRRVIAVGTLGL